MQADLKNQTSQKYLCGAYKESRTLFAYSVWEHGQEMFSSWEDKDKMKGLKRIYEHGPRSGNLTDDVRILAHSLYIDFGNIKNSEVT